MSWRIFLTETKRSWQICVSTVVLCFLLGAILFSVISFKEYLADLFRPQEWDAQMLILPKAVTPEVAIRDLKNGEPSALIPSVLYKTLKGQVDDERARKGISEDTIQLMGFVPYKDVNTNKLSVAIWGDAKFLHSNLENSVWKNLELQQWEAIKNQLQNNDKYQTNEWKSDVLLGIAARGQSEYLENLKTLIDRRTVAQAFYVSGERSLEAKRYNQLKSVLNFFEWSVLVLVAVGLYMSQLRMHQQRQEIKITLAELKLPTAWNSTLYVYQFLVLVLIPAALGVCIGKFVLVDFLRTLL